MAKGVFGLKNSCSGNARDQVQLKVLSGRLSEDATME